MEFDSFIKRVDEVGEIRLLETDNIVVLPIGYLIRVLVTSDDVIHSFTIPRLGIKGDANPGRLNSLAVQSLYPGVFYGQCSEICGANHRFIPIKVEFSSINMFLS